MEGKNDQWPFKIADTIFGVGNISVLSYWRPEEHSVLFLYSSLGICYYISGIRVASWASGLATHICSYVI